MMDLTDEVDAAARAVIGSLDADGFFRGDCGGGRSARRRDAEQAEEGLRVVQQLDPPGVGARTLAEALMIQMEFLGLEEPLLEQIIVDHLDDVAANHFRKISRALKVERAEVREAVGLLRSLNPRPAGAYSPGPSPGYIVPDVTDPPLRRRVAHHPQQRLRPDAAREPPLPLDAAFGLGSRRRDAALPQGQDPLGGELHQEHRQAQGHRQPHHQIILEVQSEFFEDGKGPLRPLRLEDVAIEIGVHLSTVSRGVTGKYMATPYGLFELKHFFAGGYRTSTGMDIASTSIKQRLKELVAEEDSAKPLSDQKLAELLSAEGVTVARRTVAKYREELNVEPSWARRRR
jgi:RNA polymerase sigma-54 factor